MMKTKIQMKVMRSMLPVVFALAVMAVLPSCKGQKGVAASEGNEKMKEPFSSEEFRSDGKYIRFTGVEETNDLSSAKTVALIQAQTGISMLANKKIEGMFTNYLNYSNAANRTEAAKHIQSLFDGMVQINLPFTRIIGEEVYHDKETGAYTCYIAAEISIADLEKESLRILHEDARLKNLVSEEGYRALMEKKLRQANEANTSGNNQ